MQRLLDHPALFWLFDRIDRAGRAVRADELVSLADQVCPLPPPFLLLQCLVDSGYLEPGAPALALDTPIGLTEAGVGYLAAARAAGQRPGCEIAVVAGPPALSEDDVVAFLAAVERGDVTLTPGRRGPNVSGTGLVSFAASNGWRIKVFEEEGRWAYLDSVMRDKRHFAGFETLRDEMPRVAAYVPSEEVARRCYGIAPTDGPPRGRRRRGSELEVNKARAFDYVLDVLAGRRRVTPREGSSKTMRFLFDSEADAVADAHQLAVHLGVRRAEPHRYFADVTPGIVSEIMTRAGLDEVRSPIVIGLPPGEVRAPGFVRWAYKATLVWLVPAADHLVLRTRHSPEIWGKPYVAPLPNEGPLGLPTLPEWQKPAMVYRDFDPPRACPRCAVASARYRDLGEALVCEACGRSFEAARLEARMG